ncbi:MAG: prepilin peptidase [Elusimicrobiota bacterium]
MSGNAFLGVILLIGGAATASDWRENRVPNRLTLFGFAAFAAGAAYHLLAASLGHRGINWSVLGEHYMPWRFFPRLGAHALLSLAAGWTLWRLDIWPAGDAKLYIVLSWLMPLANANLSGFPLLLFMVFLINCFVPSGLLVAGEMIVRLAASVPGIFSGGIVSAVKSHCDRAVRRVKDLRPLRLEAAALLVNLTCLFFLMRLAQTLLHRQPLGPFVQILVFFALIAVWQRLAALFLRPLVGAAALCIFCGCAVACVAAGLDLGGILWRTAKTTAGFGVFLSFARLAVHRAVERCSLRDIPPEELRPGALLSDAAWEALSQDADARGIVAERNCDGLTAAEALALRGKMTARGERSLSVYRTVPFAAWIFLGAILTLAHRGTVVSWAKAWISP